LQEDLLAVHEREHAEAVVLRLVRPLLPLREGSAGQRELGIDRGLERERHAARS